MNNLDHKYDKQLRQRALKKVSEVMVNENEEKEILVIRLAKMIIKTSLNESKKQRNMRLEDMQQRE